MENEYRDAYTDLEIELNSENFRLRSELATLKAQEPVIDELAAFEDWWPSVGQTIGKVAALEAWQARAQFAIPVVSAEQQGVADGWIAVSERLPEPFTVVALLDDSRWMNTGSDDFEANWTSAGWMNDCSSRPYWAAIGEPRGLVLEAVTHWMPLPAAPALSTTEGQGDE